MFVYIAEVLGMQYLFRTFHSPRATGLRSHTRHHIHLPKTPANSRWFGGKKNPARLSRKKKQTTRQLSIRLHASISMHSLHHLGGGRMYQICYSTTHLALIRSAYLGVGSVCLTMTMLVWGDNNNFLTLKATKLAGLQFAHTYNFKRPNGNNTYFLEKLLHLALICAQLDRRICPLLMQQRFGYTHRDSCWGRQTHASIQT